MAKQCRWGILGAANIAMKLWTAIKSSGSGCVRAVASRDAARAAEFIRRCQADDPMVDSRYDPQVVDAVGGYQNLLDREDIDAVYVPLPTAARAQWVIAAARAGKHVLCEKPAAVNLQSLQTMLDACQQAGVQWMDGVMFDHSARIEPVAEQARTHLGDIRRVECHFSFLADKDFESNIRADSRLEPHGALGDLGWYGIRFVDHLLGQQLPQRVRCGIRRTVGDGVPSECFAQMESSEGWIAEIFCSFHSVNRQTAVITGTSGYLSLDDFVLPMTGGRSRWDIHRHHLDIQGGRWTFDRRDERCYVDEAPSGLPGAQEVTMIRRMNELVLSGKRDHRYVSRTLRTQTVMDAMRASAARNEQWIEPENV